MNRLRNFMFGRYGLDTLNIALIILGCVITFVTSFIRTPYYRLLGFIPYIIVLCRALSRNHAARAKENNAFLKVWVPCRNFFKKKHSQYADKDHRYYKCPKCKHVLRVPKGRGKIQISCPYCQTKFKKNTGKPKVNYS